jgi:hypothetical protein
MYTLDEGKRKGVGSGMGLFLSVGHLPKDLVAKIQKEPTKCVYCKCWVNSFPPGLKFVLDWQAISFSSC